MHRALRLVMKPYPSRVIDLYCKPYPTHGRVEQGGSVKQLKPTLLVFSTKLLFPFAFLICNTAFTQKTTFLPIAGGRWRVDVSLQRCGQIGTQQPRTKPVAGTSH